MDKPIDLYYEAHITVKPYKRGSDLDRSMKIACERYDMRVSTFLMFVKPGEKPKAFASMRSQSRTDIVERTCRAVSYLKSAGHDILRYKIEETLFDSRHSESGDPLGIFGGLPLNDEVSGYNPNHDPHGFYEK